MILHLSYKLYYMKAHLKTLLIAIVYVIAIKTVDAQVSVTNDGSGADSSAMLDIQSTTRGFLVPRLTAEQKSNISGPATGLLIYQTDGSAGFYYNQGSPSNPDWTILSSSATSTLWLRSPSDNATYLANIDDSVGVGKSVPTEKLDVQGNLDLDSFQPMIVFREDSLEAARIIHMGSPMNGYLQLQAWDGNNFETTGLVVEAPAQQVGIGTTNPAFKLDVLGTTRTSGFILSSATADGYVLTSDENGVATWQQAASHLAGTGAANRLAKYETSDTLGSSVIYEDEAGRIGIGTSYPQETLDVNGKLYMEDNILLNNNWLSGDGNDEGLFVTGGGNVGVGTNSPASRLTSNGMIQTMSGGVKFPDNTVQTTAAINDNDVNPMDAAAPRWFIGMQLEGIQGPYNYEDCMDCCKVFGLKWYFNNTYDSITGLLTNNYPQQHVVSVLKDIDQTTVELIQRLHSRYDFDVDLYFYFDPPGEDTIMPYYKIHLEHAILTKLGHEVIYLGNERYAHIDRIDFIFSDIFWERLWPQGFIFIDDWGP